MHKSVPSVWVIQPPLHRGEVHLNSVCTSRERNGRKGAVVMVKLWSPSVRWLLIADWFLERCHHFRNIIEHPHIDINWDPAIRLFRYMLRRKGLFVVRAWTIWTTHMLDEKAWSLTRIRDPHQALCKAQQLYAYAHQQQFDVHEGYVQRNAVSPVITQRTISRLANSLGPVRFSPRIEATLRVIDETSQRCLPIYSFHKVIWVLALVEGEFYTQNLDNQSALYYFIAQHFWDGSWF